MTPRRKLGRAVALGKREVIFLTPEGIECDSSDQFHLTQRRVLFEDTELLTLHRQTDKVFITIAAIVALLFLAGGVALYMNAGLTVALTPLLMGAVIAAAAIFRLTLKPSVITVFGKRSNISVRFTVNHAQARATYQELQTAIHSAQQTQRLQSTAAPAPMVAAEPATAFDGSPQSPADPFAPPADPFLPIPEPPRDREA